MNARKHESKSSPLIATFDDHRYFCPVALPGFRFLQGNDYLSRIRQLLYRKRYPKSLKRNLRIARQRIAWPRLAARLADRACATWGQAAVAEGGVSMPEQRAQLVAEATANNISFVSYYAYQLWRPERLASADLYFQEFESNWLNSLLRQGQNHQDLDDKLRFAEFCRRHGLNTVPVSLGLTRDGAEHWRSPQQRLPDSDLFVKSINLARGIGTERWEYLAESRRWRRDHVELDQAGLLQHWRKHASQYALLVQPRVRSHPSHTEFNPDALGTLRCMTYKCAGESAGVSRASMRFPRSGMITDNACGGGIASAVEPDGRLRAAEGRWIGPGFSHHPDWQVALEGRELPGYRQMTELCLRAHDAAALVGFVSWDVAMTESGATLIEANTDGGLLLLQESWNSPLGVTDFPEIAWQMLLDRGHC